ncbi:hypothetical protein QBC34DRAFT_461158 [Podospora aff. communis PSN243]|uniref:Killer toxin Kp4 domain-containing protein n=1 Tax=Podospora aff. communis PSN243 TaxID=3040156 RepID=A0AAV9GQM4_9PEZI|nr:hypothetical protein QBC34DRAFT_461158 [Podospora aff. communis PSN243]
MTRLNRLSTFLLLLLSSTTPLLALNHAPLPESYPPSHLTPRFYHSCRDNLSAACDFVPKTITTPTGAEISTIEALRLGMHASTMSNKTIFCNGEIVICFSKSWSIDLGAGIGRIGGPEFSFPVDILDGAICAFLEGFDGARPLTFQEVRALMDELFGQGCRQCGRIETNWLDGGERGYKGYLKVDYRKVRSVCAQRYIGPSVDLGLGWRDEYEGRSCAGSVAAVGGAGGGGRSEGGRVMGRGWD